MMRVLLAVPFALAVTAASAQEAKCPCTYTLTQEQRTALWQTLTAASYWNDTLNRWLSDTAPIIISKQQQGLIELGNTLRQQDKAAVEKAAKELNDQDKAAAEKAAKDKAEKKAE